MEQIKFTKLVENTIRDSKEKLKENRDEELETIPVPITHYDHKCPHCGEMIHEKGTYSDDGGQTFRHGICKGKIKFWETEESKKEKEAFFKKLGIVEKKQLKESEEEEVRTYKIQANSDTFKRLENLFACLEYCNNGSSRSFVFGQDGDGSDWFKLVSPEKKKLTEEEMEEISNGGIEVSYSVINVGTLGEK